MTRKPKDAVQFSIVSAARRQRLRSWQLRLMALGLGTLAALGIAELTLRIGGFGCPNLYEPDEFCGSRLRRATSGVWTKEGHGRVTVNSLGFRGAELACRNDSAEKVFRIVVAGDSFVEALQVDDDETFCARLQLLLNSRAPDRAPRYEVINGGVSGYGTPQELPLLQHYLMPLKPDAVLLAVYPENDVRNNSLALEGASSRPCFRLTKSGGLDLDLSFRTHESWLSARTSYERSKAAVINRFRLLQLIHQFRNSTGGVVEHPANAEVALRSAVREA